MTQIDTWRDLVPSAGFDDIEWELTCSPREVCLGALPASDEWSLQAAGVVARTRPWRPAATTPQA